MSFNPHDVVQRFSHTGICVSDLERSKKFYKEGLGFEYGAPIHVENCYQGLLGMPDPITMNCQFMRKGDVVIELIHFSPPAVIPSPGLRPMNQIGLTHLSFFVKDIDATANTLKALGGSIIESTRTIEHGEGRPEGLIIFCTDPDGTRIELMAYPDGVRFA